MTGGEVQARRQWSRRATDPDFNSGYDTGPYFTAATWITKDIDSSVQNMGVYRGNLKAADRLAVMMQISTQSGGYNHWKGYQKRKEKMPVCISSSAARRSWSTPVPKSEARCRRTYRRGRSRRWADQYGKGQNDGPLCASQAQIVVEGYIDPEYLGPEAFGESHGYIALEGFNNTMDVTAITMQKKPVVSSIISQVTPSDSSVIKRVAYEPMFKSYLRDTLESAAFRRCLYTNH